MSSWVWVAYVHEAEQFHLQVPFNQGMTALDAIQASGIEQHVTLATPWMLGIFGERIDAQQLLSAGDRVEIYRALTINPKDIRRHRATNHPTKSNRLKRSV